MSKNINIDTVRNERISQIDEIWNSDNKGSNARISFTTNIISDVSKNTLFYLMLRVQVKMQQQLNLIH